MRPFIEPVKGVSDDVMGITVVEDETTIRTMIVKILKGAFPKIRVSALEDVGGVEETLSSDAVDRLWLVDLNLNGEPMPAQELAMVLRRTAERTAMVLMSGSDFSEVTISEVGDENLLQVFVLPKPFQAGELVAIVRRAMAYVLGESTDEVPVDDFEEATFERSLANFSTLEDLVAALPSDFAKVVRYEGMARELSSLLVKELESLRTACDGSFAEFYACWQRAFFPVERSHDRRVVLLAILGEIDNAPFPLQTFLHDVNNVLTPYVLSRQDDVSGNRWVTLRLRLIDFIQASLGPFAGFVKSGDSQEFLSSQNVNSALLQLNLEELDTTADGSICVSCPTGTLMSIFRTFLSNYLKVRRLSGQSSARLKVSAHEVEDELRVRLFFTDDLKSFQPAVFGKIFDDQLPSEQNQGLGTGLLQTWKIVEQSRGALTSFHRRDDVWWKKSPNESPSAATEAEIEMIQPYLFKGATKIFMMELPVAANESASETEIPTQ